MPTHASATLLSNFLSGLILPPSRRKRAKKEISFLFFWRPFLRSLSLVLFLLFFSQQSCHSSSQTRRSSIKFSARHPPFFFVSSPPSSAPSSPSLVLRLLSLSAFFVIIPIPLLLRRLRVWPSRLQPHSQAPLRERRKRRKGQQRIESKAPCTRMEDRNLAEKTGESYRWMHPTQRLPPTQTETGADGDREERSIRISTCGSRFLSLFLFKLVACRGRHLQMRRCRASLLSVCAASPTETMIHAEETETNTTDSRIDRSLSLPFFLSFQPPQRFGYLPFPDRCLRSTPLHDPNIETARSIDPEWVNQDRWVNPGYIAR